MGIQLTKEVIKCHYDTQPYRNAFHQRNSPCCLVSCSFVLFVLLINVGTILLSTTPSNQGAGSTDFTAELIKLSKLNRSIILHDIKEIYPNDLKLSISPQRVTANQQYPICFPAPQFLLPFLTSNHRKDAPTDEDTPISAIDEIKKTTQLHDSAHDNIFKYTRASFQQSQAMQEEETWSSVRVEDVWEALIGYPLDPNCFIRIDPSSSTLMEQLNAANVDPATHQQIICSNYATDVMEPSFIVINPDNGVVYQLTVNVLYETMNGCQTFANTLSFDALDKATLDELLSEKNPTVMEFFDLVTKYMFYIFLIVAAVIMLLCFAWMAYSFASMIFEATIATLIVWILVLVLWTFGAFEEYDNVSPTLRQIWRLNVLLCVPDFSFVRILELSSMSIYWKIGARVFITLLLIIDVYQHDPPSQRIASHAHED